MNNPISAVFARRPDLVIGGVFLSVAVLMYAGVLRPGAAAAHEREAATERIEAARRDATELDQSAIAARARLDAAQKTLEGTRRRVAPVARLNQRLGELAGVIEETGTRIDEFTPGEPVVIGRYGEVAITVRARAGIEAVVAWLSALPGEFPDVAVARLEIAAEAPNSEGVATVLVSARLNLYVVAVLPGGKP